MSSRTTGTTRLSRPALHGRRTQWLVRAVTTNVSNDGFQVVGSRASNAPFAFASSVGSNNRTIQSVNTVSTIRSSDTPSTDVQDQKNEENEETKNLNDSKN